jgi:hypothetical protein
MLEPARDVKVTLAVTARVTADEAGVGELLEVVLDVDRRVLRAQGPEHPGDDRRVVPVPAVVVGLSEQTDVRDHPGHRAGRDAFVDEEVWLDGAYAGHVSASARLCRR